MRGSLGKSSIAKQNPGFSRLKVFTVQPRKPSKAPTLNDTGWVEAGPAALKDGITHIRAWFPDCLGEFEQSVLLGLLNLCGRTREEDREFVAGTEEVYDGPGAADRVTMRLTTTASAILTAARLAKNSNAYARLDVALDRLAGIQVKYITVEGNTRWEVDGERLVTSKREKDHDGADKARITFNLSERLADVFLKGVPEYRKIDMDERHDLRGDVARIAHAWLSVRVREGDPAGLKVRVDTVADGIWLNPPRTPEEAKTRRHEVRKALEAIGSLEVGGERRWSVRWADASRSKATVVRSQQEGEDE